MLNHRRSVRAALLASLLFAPTLLTDCSSAEPLSLGDAKAGSGSAGANSAGQGAGGSSAGTNSAGQGAGTNSAGQGAGTNSAGTNSAGTNSAGTNSAGTNSAGTSSAGQGAGGTSALCPDSDCGPQLGLPNYVCDDGSIAGPTGRCLKRDNGSCGWEVVSCPSGNGGSGGQASGGASGQLCGGKLCGAGQACCGPAACGHCVNELSGQACPAQCAGGNGGTGSGGASGGASSADCSALLALVQSTLAVAQACNTGSDKPGLECAGTLEGLCCPVLVEFVATGSNSANEAYLNALHTYQTSCTHVCPKIACIAPQPGSCVAASGSALGTCGGGKGF